MIRIIQEKLSDDKYLLQLSNQLAEEWDKVRNTDRKSSKWFDLVSIYFDKRKQKILSTTDRIDYDDNNIIFVDQCYPYTFDEHGANNSFNTAKNCLLKNKELMDYIQDK